MASFVNWVLLFALILVAQSQNDLKGYSNTECRCFESSAECVFPNIGGIPPLPPRITSFTLTLEDNVYKSLEFYYILSDKVVRTQGNKITIDNLFFSNISQSNIKELIIKGGECSMKVLGNKESVDMAERMCFILEIENNAFENMRNLENIKILNVIPTDGRNNAFKAFPYEAFDSSIKGSLVSLTIAGGILRVTDYIKHFKMQKLKILDLSDNKIQNVSLTRLEFLLTLKLAKNLIESIPEWYAIRNGSYEEFLPKLLELDLTDNLITYIRRWSFYSLPSLKRLTLDKNRIQMIEPSFMRDLKYLHFISISQNTGDHIFIHCTSFQSTSLLHLKLTENSFNQEMIGSNFFISQEVHSSCDDNLFSYTPNLERLELNYNRRFLTSRHSLSKIIKPLKNLKILMVKGLHISTIPEDTFHNNTLLQEIYMDDNDIQEVNKMTNVFCGASSLRSLTLSGNNITDINENFLVHSLPRSLKHLDLSNNPFSCSCALIPFKNWIDSTFSINIKGYPNFYTCSSPAKFRGRLLRDFNPNQDNCNPDPWTIYAIPLIIIGGSTFILIFVFYSFRYYIKNICYILRLTMPCSEKTLQYFDDQTKDCEFDAFVIYCDADRLWVHKKLLPKIEKENNFKLCIHHREFDVGESIVDNIDKYVSKSRKIIVVMSNEFTKSEWCQYEMDIVQQRRKRFGRHIFVLIMLKTVDFKHMTGPMKILLSTSPHLTYIEGFGEEIFWRGVMKGIRKPIGLPPVAI